MSQLLIDRNETYDLIGLMTDFRWEVFSRLVGRIREVAQQRIKSRKNTLQDYGYWSGVIQTCEDIESLPQDLARQIKEETKEAE